MREYPNIITDLEKWPIARFYDDRQRVVRQLSQSTQAFLNGPGQSRNLQTTLRETIYSEKLRAKSNPLKVDPPKEYAYWKKMEADLGRAMQDDAGARATLDILGRTVNRYSEEIAGNFNVKTFRFARKALSMLFGSLYKPFVANGKAFWGDRESLLDRFEVVGPMDHIRGLFDKGTVMILPTHFSNLDSILIGYGIEMMTGMPAFSYGAGLNLYDYELMAYYMSRLGAYKIDRRKKNPVYAETLRQFSILSIHEGLNSIFFPGGTRSRSGAIEDRVKLGLMNTLIDSQNDFYMRGQDRKIIAIPLVISYNFVLEASSLIEQHLRKTGKASYLNSTRKSKVRNKTFKFINRLFKSQSGVTLSFGQPMDVMGHLLDEEGNSIKGGRTIDIKGYFTSSGLLTKDVQRNRVYSRLFGNAITSSFRRENVVLVSHL
ncbi:MAG: 1-acyl-sn-glycerol-3-phosphate acyltransferase, partial [Bacteroidota bacterium]